MRLPTLFIGLLLIAPAASALTVGLDARETLDELVPPSSYLVGFHEFPRGIEIGDDYEGGRVAHVDEVLHFVTVETRNPLTFEARARADDRVRYVEPNGVWTISYTPNDPKYGSEQYGPQNINAPAAWDTTLGDSSVKVCIVDTGIRSTHEDVGRYVAGYDFVSNDATPQDGNGHGTHVATTAVGTTNNGKGIAGVAQASLLVARVLDNQGSGSYDWIASGIRWCADNGAHVISMSLGGSSTTTALSDAVNYAAGKGSLQIAATGNSGPCTNCVGYPAKYAEVMAVACTTSSRAQCSFSSEGPEVDIAAPGYNVVAAWHTSDTAYNTISGTSMSTPHVAGVAALVKSANPSFTKEGIRSAIQDTARDLGASGWDQDFGHGEVDAAAAVGGGGTPPPPPPSEGRIFFEDFDDGSANGWTLGGLWHVASACSTPPSSPNYLGYNEDSDCQYSTGARTTGSATFTVDTTGATVGTLNFDHRWDTESYSGGAYDIMRVEASANGGTSWTMLRQWDSRDANQLSWGAASMDLDAVVGGSLQLRFFFDTVDGSYNTYPGWFVDKVEVTADSGGTPPPPTNDPPTANAGADQTRADADGSGAESVTLDGTGSSDSDGTIASYEWREGSTLLATGATPTVSFGVGSHTVTLTVTDDDGATDTDTVVITVNANQGPTASFTRSVSSLTVSTDASGSSDSDGTISSYAWAWGDGTSGSGVTASHTYGAAGTYTITLTVTDNGGATASASSTVTVAAGESVVYSENFDDGSAQGWSKSGSTDLWHLEDGCVADHTAAYKLAWTRAGNCDYNTGSRVTNWVKSGAVSLSGKSQATLKFVHQFDIEQYSGAAYDKLLVQASSDGSTWTTLQQWDSRNADVTSWTAMSYDVDAYAGGNLYLRFYTDTMDNVSNNHAGWYIDNVEVTAS